MPKIFIYEFYKDLNINLLENISFYINLSYDGKKHLKMDQGS